MTDERLPIYRLFTGPDDSTFCRRVSEALSQGYILHGSPSITSVDGRGYVAQAIVMDKAGVYPGFQTSSEIEPD